MAQAVLRPLAQLCCGLTVARPAPDRGPSVIQRASTLKSLERACTWRVMRCTVRYYYVLFFAWIALYVSLAGVAAAWAFTRADNTPFSAQTSYDWNIASAPESMANDATNAAFQSVESAQVTARSQVRCPSVSPRACRLRRGGPSPRLGPCVRRAPTASPIRQASAPECRVPRHEGGAAMNGCLVSNRPIA
jgi:hypothetical protein